MRHSMLRMTHNGMACGGDHQMGRISQLPALIPQGGPGLSGLRGFTFFHGLGMLGDASQYLAGTAIQFSDPSVEYRAGGILFNPSASTLQAQLKTIMSATGVFVPTTLTVTVTGGGLTSFFNYSITVLGNLAQSLSPSQIQSMLNQALNAANFSSSDATAQTLSAVSASPTPFGSQSSGNVQIPMGNSVTGPRTVSFYDASGNPLTASQVVPQEGGTSFVFADGSDVYIGNDGTVSGADSGGNDLDVTMSPDGTIASFGDGSIAVLGAPSQNATPTTGTDPITQIANALASTFGFHPAVAPNPNAPKPPTGQSLGDQLSSFFSSFGAPFGLGALGTLALLGVGYVVLTNTGGGRRR